MKDFYTPKLCELQKREVKIHYCADGIPMSTICQCSLVDAEDRCPTDDCVYHLIFQVAARLAFGANYGGMPISELVARGLMFEAGEDFKTMGSRFLMEEMGGKNLFLKDPPKKPWWRFGR